ncbi:MAG: hypothetical protein Q7K03_10600 [Dehalococcoidia bacterium]|nr:hypothetical protein [Dehalococcoidia bacterium]
MNSNQASEIRNALTIINRRTQLARVRLNGLPAISMALRDATICDDLDAIDTAAKCILAVAVEMEREAGIGATVVHTTINAKAPPEPPDDI